MLPPQTVRTFFVTSNTDGRRAILGSERMSGLLINVLQDYRKKGRFLLHEFVIMPDHFHLLITPAPNIPLEKALQFVKGGFSYRVKKELHANFSLWQKSFTNHRIRDAEDCERHCVYIWENPVKARLVAEAELFPFSSAFPNVDVDPAPPWLKPISRARALSRA